MGVLLRKQREGYVRAEMSWPRDCPYRQAVNMEGAVQMDDAVSSFHPCGYDEIGPEKTWAERFLANAERNAAHAAEFFKWMDQNHPMDTPEGFCWVYRDGQWLLAPANR